MKLGKTLHVNNRKDWRTWLVKHYKNETEIWLIYYRKETEKPRISYNDAVEEALCFGWIDSTVKSFNEDSSVQRFSPRNPKSSFSQANKERLKWLLQNNLLHSSVLDIAKKVLAENFVFPQDIIDAIKSDEAAWENYTKLSDSYTRIRIAYIESAKNRPEEFKKRLSNFIKKTKEDKLIKGFGGIEKYY